jgi:hypothetical protein
MKSQLTTDIRKFLLDQIRVKKIMWRAVVNGALFNRAACVVDLSKIVYFFNCIEDGEFEKLDDWQWSWPDKVVSLGHTDPDYKKAMKALAFLKRPVVGEAKIVDLIKINRALTKISKEMFCHDFDESLFDLDGFSESEVLQEQLA